MSTLDKISNTKDLNELTVLEWCIWYQLANNKVVEATDAARELATLRETAERRLEIIRATSDWLVRNELGDTAHQRALAAELESETKGAQRI